MSRNKPFTTIAAIVFLLMALAHLYRIAVGFDVTVGAVQIPQWVSWIALIVTGLLATMLFRESRS